MAFKIAGRFIALSQVREVASSGQGQQPFKKQEIYMDCTRYDPYTGERSQYENKPLLEFGGDKVLAKLESLNIKPNDIVKVSFEIQGTPYTDKNTGKMRVYTGIRCYDIEVTRRADGSVPSPQPQTAAPAPQTAAPEPAPAPSNNPNDGLPF